MSFLARIVRESLVHFLLIGVAVFALYAFTTRGALPAPPRDRLVVTSGRIQQLAEIFTRTWQRPHSPRPPQTESTSTPSVRAACSSGVPTGNRPRFPEGVNTTRASVMLV